MLGRLLVLPSLLIVAVGVLLLGELAPLEAQFGANYANTSEARSALEQARDQQRSARARGLRFERLADQTDAASLKSLRQAVALAARIQQSEAGMAAANAEIALIGRQRRVLDRQLAIRRAPLVRLTGALQAMARRPLSLAALQPGSLRDLVYTRAVLASTIPRVRALTSDLRRDLDRVRALGRASERSVAVLRAEQQALAERRAALVRLGQSQRLAARRMAGDASREAARALALGEQARDLDGLVATLEQAGSLREQLAALPGPIPRPANPAAARIAAAPPQPAPSATVPPRSYQLPVTGRVIAGFGEADAGGARQSGIAIAPPASAQVVAPGAGRVAFAGPYRGYGQIVIVEHVGGWTSLVTGLASLDTQVGRRVASGSPLGLAAARGPRVTLELRRDGTPVNPLDYAR